jgi:hypothetical protein
MESKNDVRIHEEFDAAKDSTKDPDRRHSQFRAPFDEGVVAATETLTIEWNKEYLSSIRAARLEIEHAADGTKPKIFDEHLDRWCNRLVDLQRKLISNYTELALAHPRAVPTDTVNWLLDTVKQVWMPLTKGYRGWVICACDRDGVTHEWTAPSWLARTLPCAEFQAILTPGLRLSREDTSLILDAVLSFVNIRLVHAQKRDFNSATVRIRSEKIARQRAPRQDPTKALIASWKARYPRISQAKICGKLDAQNVPLLKSWQAFGCKTWSDALRHSKLKNRVKKYISSIKPGKRPSA